MDLRVVSYNMGMGLGDYSRLLDHCKKNMSNTEKVEKYAQVQNETARLLAGQADVYCLQEVMDDNRPLIQGLENKNFTLIYTYNKWKTCDSLIALDNRRFKNITDHSLHIEYAKNYKKDIAIATAFDIKTAQTVTFVSAHVPGFSFGNPGQAYLDGYKFMNLMMEKVDTLGGEVQIIGADMNTNPKLKVGKPVFDNMSARRFRLANLGAATNVFPTDFSHKTREIDFIFLRVMRPYSIWQKIRNIFFSEVDDKVKTDSLLGWDPEKNASDHLPIRATISCSPSKIYELWKTAYRFFSLTLGACLSLDLKVSGW